MDLILDSILPEILAVEITAYTASFLFATFIFMYSHGRNTALRIVDFYGSPSAKELFIKSLGPSFWTAPPLILLVLYVALAIVYRNNMNYVILWIALCIFIILIMYSIMVTRALSKVMLYYAADPEEWFNGCDLSAIVKVKIRKYNSRFKKYSSYFRRRSIKEKKEQEHIKELIQGFDELFQGIGDILIFKLTNQNTGMAEKCLKKMMDLVKEIRVLQSPDDKRKKRIKKEEYNLILDMPKRELLRAESSIKHKNILLKCKNILVKYKNKNELDDLIQSNISCMDKLLKQSMS